MNNRGQDDIVKIIGAIISLFFVITFFAAMIPVFSSITGQDDKQNEINSLNNKVLELEQQNANKDVQISQLQGLLGSLNSTISDRDKIISNLTGQITEKDNKILELNNTLQSYLEREYLPTINNNYYNILNYVERIENKFFTINLSIGLISLTLLSIVVKMFGLDVTIKLLFNRLRRKKE